MALVLLLALLLPVQGFAGAWGCRAQGAATAAPHHHCSDDSGKAQTGEQRHHCGTCCAAAIALMPFRWTPPRPVSSEHFLPLHGAPPKVALDRLDRPPRPIRS